MKKEQEEKKEPEERKIERFVRSKQKYLHGCAVGIIQEARPDLLEE